MRRMYYWWGETTPVNRPMRGYFDPTFRLPPGCVRWEPIGPEPATPAVPNPQLSGPAVPIRQPDWFRLPLAQLDDRQRLVRLSRCRYRGERIAGQGCGGTLYRCTLYGDHCNTLRPCQQSQRCCQDCLKNSAHEVSQ